MHRLEARAQGSVEVSTKAGTGFAGFVKAGRNGDLLPSSAAAPNAKAADFLGRYEGLLGVGGASVLAPVSSAVDERGATHITYEQVYRGVPVFGAEVKAHVDPAGNLTAVNGAAVPDIDLSVTPRLSPAEAAARAVAAVAANPLDESSSAGALSADSVALVVYRTGLIRGVAGTNQLAYQVRVGDAAGPREMVFVHAHAGKVLNRYPLRDDDLHRVVYEQSTANQIWEEGDAFPGALNADQRNIVDASGDAYRFFRNTFGRDSYDAAGAVMRSVSNDPRITCPNANWDHETTNFCNGETADDVVAHEWGHAYTEYTDGLIYQWQPGALNESYSDIWGEVIDQINGAQTDSPNTVRTVGECSQHSDPVPILRVNAPQSIAGDCRAGAARFGPPVTAAGTRGQVVLAREPSGATTGCTGPFTETLAGKIALIDRGTCTFAIKVKNAQNAGAIGVVIGNTTDTFSDMGGADASITIPSIMISLGNRNLIAGRLTAGETVDVTLRGKGANAPEDSYRWLHGEDAIGHLPTAPPGGHASRDMWDPTCLGDPGRVSDVEYHCDSSDAGGVHENSGVPNHGFALLVDGGTYNGRTVVGLGWTKAVHIYWRAQSVYQTPTTDFADHADALEAACRDLVGATLEALSTGAPIGPSGEVISAADCASVTAMAAAVELRTSPTEQCGFKPLLAPGAPAVCEGQKNPPVIYSEDFEQGLHGWQVSNEGRYAGWSGTDWRVRGALPGGRGGSAAFGADPNAGSCDAGPADRSGVMHLTSPAIRLPVTKILASRLSFRHYVATEPGYDGGNLKISVNGGAFELVPASALLFNAYNAQLLTEADDNTNPLAGQPAFSGSDGGELKGSWALSQVDLSALGVEAGDTVQLRFDMGTDGCTGLDGWYIDDVQVTTCTAVEQSKDTDVGGTVPATLSLSLGAPASFAAFRAGVAADYTASTTATVISTAGDATLSVLDPSASAPGRLVNGPFALPQPLQVRAGNGSYAPVSGSPAAVRAYGDPVSNDVVAIGFKQSISATDALRTGTYGKTLTLTLSTTTP
ncbi:MAG TPA: M4 family metallopeptidase [Solirubrobacter sp.]|nr:M4 family metallopeptidase [Solirubrobacter sp.]